MDRATGNLDRVKRRAAVIAILLSSAAVLGCARAAEEPPSHPPQARQGPQQPLASPRARAQRPAHIAAVGDIACSPMDSHFADGKGEDGRCYQADVARLVRSLRVDGLLLMGDIQYDSGTAEEFAGSFDTSWGQFRRLAYPTPGNHEFNGGAALGYFSYFGERAGPAERGYYGANIGAWRVLSLNSNCSISHACAREGAQVRWLRSELQRHTRQCTLVMWHHPRFSSGFHGDTPDVDALWRAAANGGADLALAGHDHHYERFASMDAHGSLEPSGGLQSFVVGTGGKESYPTLFPQAGSKRRISRRFGVLDLQLATSGWTSSFVELDGARTDPAAGKCGKSATDRP